MKSVAEKSRVSTQVCRAAAAAVTTTTTEVELVQCECCGLAEECTPAYIAQVRDMNCGKWVCGLCAEAVKEERGRCGGFGEEEEALQAHMSFCKQFNNDKAGKESPVADLAAAMRLLLRRSVDAGSPSSSRSAPSSPRRDPSSSSVHRTKTSFPRGFEAPL